MTSQTNHIERTYTRLTRSRDRASAAECLRAIGDCIGMPSPSVIDDYDEPRLLRAEDGRSLAAIFGWTTEYHDDWFKHRLHRVSPIALACRATTEPFAWDAESVASEVSRTRPSAPWHLTPARGVFGGITVPLHGPHGRIGSVVWMAREPDVDADAILATHGDALRFAAHAFIDLVHTTEKRMEISRCETTPGALTAREFECLAWAARGHTDNEIGVLLCRSPATARFHIDNATHKLGARNRTHAVAKAVQLGLIQVTCESLETEQ